MTNEFKLISGRIENEENNIEITLKSPKLYGNKLVLAGIEELIDSIDLDEDLEYKSMTRLLYKIADQIGFHGWYDHSSEFNIQYNDNSEEGYVSNREKRILIRQFLESEEKSELK